MASRKKSRNSSRRALAVAAILPALVLGACSSQGGNAAYEADVMPTTSEEFAGGSDASQESLDMAAEAALPGAKDGSSTQVTSAVIVTGDAWLITPAPVEAADDFAAYIESIGGRVESRSQSEFESHPSANIYVRMPADKYEDVVAKLSEFGRVENSSTMREDVGQTLADLNARKEVLQTSINRLDVLMEQAQTVQDLLSAEEMLTQRQSELDGLNAQLDWLSDQVQMSSMNVNFTTEVEQDSGFSWQKAWENVIASFQMVAYVLIILIPWAILVATVILIVLGIVRLRRRKRIQKFDQQKVDQQEVDQHLGDQPKVD